MTNNNPHFYNPARSAVAALRERQDLKLSKGLKADFEKLAKLEAMALDLQRTVPSRTALVDNTINNLTVDMEALAEVALYPVKVATVEEAKETHLNAVYMAIQAEAKAIISEVRKVLYTPALERIKALGEEVTPGTTPADLLRAGRGELAQEYVACEVVLDKMAEALELRTALFGGAIADGSGGQLYNVAQLDQFRSPDLAAAVWDPKRNRLANMLAAIANGAEPWCPLPTEANARRADYIEEAKARREAARADWLPSFG
ncbi:hypothetical protein BLJ79_12265 [Arthrobacter sp. UCD-GKA]|uniref:hypothetical protein n=1 Tax=Arthrobacter sp. UCD-GKA TaxID=1913576 RepID=UPI0008DC8DD8|nr:hypothetical protein [Arthrobacter sp. UCD-GKA]OIH84235.1 hypothetical protein BLJ79_12265 [Arthrobacter sp. UCD-GKA]